MVVQVRRGGGVAWRGPRGGGGVAWRGPRGRGGVAWRGPRARRRGLARPERARWRGLAAWTRVAGRRRCLAGRLWQARLAVGWVGNGFYYNPAFYNRYYNPRFGYCRIVTWNGGRVCRWHRRPWW